MDLWKVVKFGDGFAVQTPDPTPKSTDIYNVPGELIVRQDKAGIYGSELTEKDAHLIATAPEMQLTLERVEKAIAFEMQRAYPDNMNGAVQIEDMDIGHADFAIILNLVRETIRRTERKDS